jgi:membrane protein DedA with SNARE-associated domain
MSVPAGVSKMNVVRFSIFTFAGSLIWSTALEAGGYALGRSWNKLVPIISTVGTVLLVIFVFAFLGYFIYRFYVKRKKEEKVGSSENSQQAKGTK